MSGSAGAPADAPPIVDGRAESRGRLLDEPSRRHQPLRGYVALLSVYSLATGTGLWLARRKGRLPERLCLEDIALTAVATQRLARVVTKDRVTTVVRAPFTSYQHEGGPAEVEEAPKGTGVRRAIGELLVCPFCIGQWIATGFGFGLLFAPRVTRLVAGLLSAAAAADLLQLVYKGTERRALG